MNAQYVKLSMIPSGVMPTLYVSQYDVGRPLGLIVTNGTELVDMDSYSVTIEATRSDGTQITAAVTTADNIGTFQTTATMTNVAGIYKAQLVIAIASGKRIASIPFLMNVTAAAMDENGQGIAEDQSLYQQYTGTVQTLIATIRADLNTEITNRQSAVSAEAAARQTADNTLQSNINSEASTRAATDQNLQAQISQIVAPSGEAPSAAEVQNARVGADGVTYPTLGEAIRANDSQLKSQLDEIGSHMPAITTLIDPNSYTAIQYWIKLDNGKWTGNANYRIWLIPINNANRIIITANDEYSSYVALLKTNAHTAGTDPDYATGCTRQIIAPGETRIFTVPNDANYLYVAKSESPKVFTPESIVFIEYIDVATVDATLTMSGKAADAKVTGDKLTSIVDTVGEVITANFTKPASGNAVVNFAYPVRAGRTIKFIWTGESVVSMSQMNLYTRQTSSGSNVETLKTGAYANVVYKVTPTVDANYLRVSATNTGTISVYDEDTILDEVNVLQRNVAQLEEDVSKIQTTTPFVRFAFDHQMYDPSDIFGESGEMGSISGWSSKAEALTKVHAAFDALCASGGAGYGYGERITGLYKEAESDEALVDVIAPEYVTNGVTQGETVTLPIGTDSDGNPVTYNYTYESSTQPYEVRLYRFHDTNSALHTATVDIPKKKILLVGGTHGNEFCAPINLYVLAKHLCKDYANPDVLKLRSSFDVYIVPYLNGFGCQYQWSNGGVLTTGARCNGRMVDINRNCYTAGWAGATGTAEQITAHFEGKIANLATNTFAGSSNGSEFESQLIKGLIEQIQPDVFIDHHHNSGNTPFYTTCRGSYAGNLIYQAANDSAYARIHNMPQYFGTKYNLFLGSDVSPATKSAANGHMDTMAYELGVKMNCVSEMPESIAYLNGVVDSATKSATKYSALAFKQAEYTLLNVALHLCQWAMEH